MDNRDPARSLWPWSQLLMELALMAGLVLALALLMALLVYLVVAVGGNLVEQSRLLAIQVY